MALYTPDYKYQQGKKLLEELENPQGDLIRYYVAENEKHANRLQEKINEMQQVFNLLKKFIR